MKTITVYILQKTHLVDQSFPCKICENHSFFLLCIYFGPWILDNCYHLNAFLFLVWIAVWCLHTWAEAQITAQSKGIRQFNESDTRLFIPQGRAGMYCNKCHQNTMFESKLSLKSKIYMCATFRGLRKSKYLNNSTRYRLGVVLSWPVRCTRLPLSFSALKPLKPLKLYFRSLITSLATSHGNLQAFTLLHVKMASEHTLVSALLRMSKRFIWQTARKIGSI